MPADRTLTYTPFSKRREDSWEEPSSAFSDSVSPRTFGTTTRGFTGHEQIDGVGLVHMNGRVYDPLIGRFLPPDTYVQFPESSQSYNRYTYVMNNPMSYLGASARFLGPQQLFESTHTHFGARNLECGRILGEF